MLIPIGDQNLQGVRPAYVTYVLIALNLFVYFFLQGAGTNEEFTYGWSVVPLEITSGRDLVEPQTLSVGGESIQIPHHPGPSPIYLTILSAMFMHAGLMHLFGNMLYLWIFGDNIEHRFGALPFIVFYLGTGVAATLAQIALEPGSIIPSLGASGAISGVLGAYLVLFPKNKVHSLFFYFIVSVPASVAIGMWIIFQFVNGLGSFAATQETVGGVAYGAHIGGFFAGVILAFLMRMFIPKEETHAYKNYQVGNPYR